MTPLIGVSRQGEDVLTITNPNDFIFNSDQNTFKIISTALLTSQTISNGGETITIAHGQSSVPSAYAFVKYPNGVALPDEQDRGTYSISMGTVTPLRGPFRLEVDATNLYFVFTNATGSDYDVNIRYYIFEAPAV